MPKYEVIRPWHGVAEGDVVELKELHPALKANVRPVKGKAAMIDVTSQDDDETVLIPATPEGTSESERQLDKGAITKRLKELEVEFDGRKGAEDLAALLPEGELEKLFPAE